MFLGSVGIILKKNHILPYKMVILDKVRGKIECVTSLPSFSIGTLITYNISDRQTTCFISEGTLIYIPLSLAQADILFFHHVLELIYYFTQINSCAPDVFNLLAFLYSAEHATLTALFKKIFLLKLLTCIGSTPEIDTASTTIITYLNTIDIHQLATITLEISDEKKLDQWLWCCVWQHPCVNKFKTVHFLAENRAL